MEFHDNRLRGNTVSDFGSTVKLHLLYEYEGQLSRQSTIAFTGVTLHHFTHTGGVIITDIEEIPVVEHIPKIATDLAGRNHWHRLTGWGNGIETSKAYAAQEGLRAWTNGSAISFAGFVIAKDIS